MSTTPSVTFFCDYVAPMAHQPGRDRVTVIEVDDTPEGAPPQLPSGWAVLETVRGSVHVDDLTFCSVDHAVAWLRNALDHAVVAEPAERVAGNS